MKKILTFATPTLLFLLFTLNVSAQQDEGDQGKGNIDLQEMARRQTEALEVIGLNLEQEKQVNELNNEYAIEINVIREEVDANRNNGRGKLISMMNKKDVDLKKILTTEQWVALVHWRNDDKKDDKDKDDKDKDN